MADDNDNKGESPTPPGSTSSRSPVGPLAPLEYLQRNQRRGSITDPSLHSSSTPQPRRPDSDPNPPRHTPPRPASPYSFGRPPTDSHLPRLRSPGDPRGSPKRSTKMGEGYVRASSGPPEQRTDVNKDDSRTWLNLDTSPSRTTDRDMEVDPRVPHRPSVQDFDYTMRRHSIATLNPSDARSEHLHDHPPPRPPYVSNLSHGVKRKNSADHSAYQFSDQPPFGGMHGPVDPDGPTPSKRRLSAFDTQKIAQLSLYDRRDSIESRSSMGAPQWWDRRDSTASMYSNASSVGGYTSATSFTPDTHTTKQYNQFPWSAPPDVDTPMGGVTPRQLPPAPPQTNSAFASDRRMSAPETSKSNGTTRTLRSRSRPPASAKPSSNTTAIPQISVPGSSPGDESGEHFQNGENGGSVSSPAASPPEGTLAPAKESTPYSRSPELRVSHKLAERKRRKEMKDLFDELRDQLPADRGMKASKWEILSKAVDYINTLRDSQTKLVHEIDLLRHELDSTRATAAAAAAQNHASYGPPPGIPPYSGSLPVGPYPTQQQPHPSHARATAHPYPPHGGPPPIQQHPSGPNSNM